MKWLHRKASFMYFAYDEIAGVDEFTTSLAKFSEAGFDSFPLWVRVRVRVRVRGRREREQARSPLTCH